MNVALSPDTLKVFEGVHERVKNRLLRLREQEEWKRYCLQHNIKQGVGSAATKTSATTHGRATNVPPRRLPTRKVTPSSPVYNVRSLADQLGVYYRELERLQGDSGAVIRTRASKISACPAEKVMTVCAQTQTVSDRLSTEPVSETRHEATQDDARDKFRIMLNPEPNERFSVVRKERVFSRSGGSGQRVTWTSPIVSSSEAKNQVSSSSVPASDLITKQTRLLDAPADLASELDLYKRQFLEQTKWKPRAVEDRACNQWTIIDSLTGEIFVDVLRAVLEEIEHVFCGVVDELLEQELEEHVSC